MPVYFWLNFKIKREQEIAVESMLKNQDVLVSLPTSDWIWEEFNVTNVQIASGQRNNTKAFARLPVSSKNGVPKRDYLKTIMCPC